MTTTSVFLRFLERLAGIVETAQAHTFTRNLHPDELLGARLAPDMLPFSKQVEIAANFALRACFPLAGQPVPPYGESPDTFDGLHAHIARVRSLLGSLDPPAFDGAETRIIQDKAGNAIVSLHGREFLSLYALPNFFFHVTTAYAILRSRGLAIGKEQFDGFHDYKAL